MDGSMAKEAIHNNLNILAGSCAIIVHFIMNSLLTWLEAITIMDAPGLGVANRGTNNGQCADVACRANWNMDYGRQDGHVFRMPVIFVT